MPPVEMKDLFIFDLRSNLVFQDQILSQSTQVFEAQKLKLYVFTQYWNCYIFHVEILLCSYPIDFCLLLQEHSKICKSFYWGVTGHDSHQRSVEITYPMNMDQHTLRVHTYMYYIIYAKCHQWKWICNASEAFEDFF